MKLILKLFATSLFFISVSLFVHSCKKEELPTVSTSSATNITVTSASSGGNVTSDGGAEVTARGICWSLNANPSISEQKTNDGTGTGQFVSNLIGLSAGLTYHVRAYATNSVGTAYGADISFTTLGHAPESLTQPVSNVSAIGATLNGTVNANYLSTTVTFEYGTSTSYGQTVTASQPTVDGNSITNVSASIIGLASGVTYHYRIKTVNSLGTTYGADMTFNTLGQAPIVVTQTASSLSPTGATLHGTVNPNFASATVTFEYGLTTSYGNSIAANPGTITGNSASPVSVIVSGLSPGTTYHFRVKAVNSVGTVYGSDLTFSTSGQAPVATTQSATNLNMTGATLNGSVNANNLSTTVTFEYGTTTSYGNTVTAGQSPLSGASSVNVSVAISGLTGGTTYHFRVKAVNSTNTTYGTDMTFTTSGAVPTCVTQAPENITVSSALLNGTVNPNSLSTTVTFEYGTTTSYGGTITAIQSPISGSSIVNVSGSINGLIIGTAYHFRVKGVNSLGTVYGGDLTFTTPNIPMISTTSVSGITQTTAESGGIITSDGGSSVTSRGVCWNTAGNPTIMDNKTNNGTGTGSFTSSITGLLPYTNYFARAYATNSAGTSYGNQIPFTTLYTPPPINGLVAYYPFNGNANDESGNGYNGTGTEVTLTFDRFGSPKKAYRFYGRSYILVPDNDNLSLISHNFTYSFWVYAYSGADAQRGVISKRRFGGADANNWEYNFYVSSSPNTFTFTFFNLTGNAEVYTNHESDKNFFQEQWINYLITSDGKILKIYKNGLLFTQGIKTTYSLGNGTGPLVFGLGGGWNQTSYFSGVIDDIRLYNRYISDSEVLSIYHEGGW